MRQRIQRMLTAAVGLLLLLSASGCGFSFSPTDLYSLPQLPEEYTELNSSLNQLLESGAEYAAPVSGSNIQPVQLEDLDGDGEEEALAFFRNSADEKPLKIYIFTAGKQGYEQAAVIEGTGTSIYSIAYEDLDQDGRKELLVGWRVNTDLLALSVYTLRSGEPEELVQGTSYVKYAVNDLNQDGLWELVVLRADEEGNGIADYYCWQEEEFQLRTSARITSTMAELSQQGKVTVGVLRSNDSALFITGVADGARAITDVLALRGGELTNLVLSAITGVSGEVSRFCSVYPMDINGDGVTEVPRTVTLQGEDADHAVSQRVDWISYDASGTASRVLSTYHDVADGWYLQLPEGWPERVWVGRSASPDEIGITFYTDSSREESCVPVLRITALSGSERERLAVRTGRFILGRNDGVIYVGELLKGNQDWKYSVTEDEVRASFSLIGTEWSAGDN